MQGWPNQFGVLLVVKSQKGKKSKRKTDFLNFYQTSHFESKFQLEFSCFSCTSTRTTQLLENLELEVIKQTWLVGLRRNLARI